jgi:hypothetical protein
MAPRIAYLLTADTALDGASTAVPRRRCEPNQIPSESDAAEKRTSASPEALKPAGVAASGPGELDDDDRDLAAMVELTVEERQVWATTGRLPPAARARAIESAWRAWLEQGPQGPIEDDGDSFPADATG